MSNVTFAERFLAETVSVLNEMDADQIEAVARGLSMVRDHGGRLFILSGSGAAGHASQSVNDFRKVCNFEAYAPTDNSEWLVGSRLEPRDRTLAS